MGLEQDHHAAVREDILSLEGESGPIVFNRVCEAVRFFGLAAVRSVFGDIENGDLRYQVQSSLRGEVPEDRMPSESRTAQTAFTNQFAA